jgi:hypothetical protein
MLLAVKYGIQFGQKKWHIVFQQIFMVI